MSETETCCIRCGRRDHLLEVECVPYTLQMDRVLETGSSQMRRRGAAFQHETVCVCPDCARWAVRRKAVTAAVTRAVICCGGLLLVAGVLLSGAGSGAIAVPAALTGTVPKVLAVAAAACVGTVAGLLLFRRYVALPDAFGAAFLREKKKKNVYSYRPCERALYPGEDEAAQRKAFSRFSGLSGTDGSILEQELWEKHTR